MNLRIVATNTSLMMLMLGALLFIPALMAYFNGNGHTAFAYGFSGVLTFVVAIILRLLSRSQALELHRKDALGTVALTWVALGLLGGLPMWIEGATPDYISAVFEAVSGFTTTGATVIPDVEALSPATNFWRCFMHWVGGMGIVVLFIAIFPQIGIGAKQLFRSEAPGPVKEGLRPRITQTALALWLIYSGLTLLCFLLLWWAGLSPYEALCHAMSTLGTGGYSTRAASVGAFDNATVEWIICAFMALAAFNFGLYYDIFRGHWRSSLANSELRFYVLLNLFVTAVLFSCILHLHDGPLESLRYALFQTLAVTTTTGFMTEDFETYPNIARYLLFFCMFIGGSAGSTSGGLKAVRLLVLIKLVYRQLKLVIQPQGVLAVRDRHMVYDNRTLTGILVFTVAFFMLWSFGAGVLVAEGLDLLSAMSASVACLASVGPGLMQVGPTQNFGFIAPLGKAVLCLLMIAGRLEIFALFALFTPAAWRRG